MAMTGLDTFNITVKKSNKWLKEIMEDQEWKDRHRAYLALRSVLHALRGRLIVDETTHLGAQLPMVIRGLHYEGWTSSGKPVKRSKEEFLNAVSEGFQNDPAIDPIGLFAPCSPLWQKESPSERLRISSPHYPNR